MFAYIVRRTLYAFPILIGINLITGLPLFPAALFIVWALLIVALAWLTEGAEADREAREP